MRFRRAFRAIFERFDRMLARMGHSKARSLYAYQRVFEGLVSFNASGGIERPRMEMSPSEVKSYLKAGIARETIILRRSPDLHRAQQIALNDFPVTEADWAHWKVGRSRRVMNTPSRLQRSPHRDSQ